MEVKSKYKLNDLLECHVPGIYNLTGIVTSITCREDADYPDELCIEYSIKDTKGNIYKLPEQNVTAAYGEIHMLRDMKSNLMKFSEDCIFAGLNDEKLNQQTVNLIDAIDELCHKILIEAEEEHVTQ